MTLVHLVRMTRTISDLFPAVVGRRVGMGGGGLSWRLSKDIRGMVHVQGLGGGMVDSVCPQTAGNRILAGESGTVVPLLTSAAAALVAPTPLPALRPEAKCL